MSGMSLKVVCCLFIMFALYEQNYASQRYCGQALMEILDAVCVNGFNKKIKKSMDLDLDDSSALNEIDEELPYPYGNSPFLAKMFGESAGSLSKTRRRRHGVYDECCRKGCSFSELASYCL